MDRIQPKFLQVLDKIFSLECLFPIGPDIACISIDQGKGIAAASKGDAVPISNFHVDALKELGGAGDWFTLGYLGSCFEIT